jgi:hypothetical protein
MFLALMALVCGCRGDSANADRLAMSLMEKPPPTADLFVADARVKALLSDRRSALRHARTFLQSNGAERVTGLLIAATLRDAESFDAVAANFLIPHPFYPDRLDDLAELAMVAAIQCDRDKALDALLLLLETGRDWEKHPREAAAIGVVLDVLKQPMHYTPLLLWNADGRIFTLVNGAVEGFDWEFISDQAEVLLKKGLLSPKTAEEIWREFCNVRVFEKVRAEALAILANLDIMNMGELNGCIWYFERLHDSRAIPVLLAILKHPQLDAVEEQKPMRSNVRRNASKALRRLLPCKELVGAEDVTELEKRYCEEFKEGRRLLTEVEEDLNKRRRDRK